MALDLRVYADGVDGGLEQLVVDAFPTLSKVIRTDPLALRPE